MASFLTERTGTVRAGLVLVTTTDEADRARDRGIDPRWIEDVQAFARLPGCAVLADEGAPASERERCWRVLCGLMGQALRSVQ